MITSTFHARILWVDSNQSERPLRELYRGVLGMQNEIVESLPALASLELTARVRLLFHVVVSDLRLPGIDGFELGRRIVELDVLASAHAALVTSFAQRGDD